MKRKIAVFANGWNNEYLSLCVKGIQKGAKECGVDIFLFVDYATYNDTEDNIRGELNILNLPDLRDFDGVLMLGNTLAALGEIDILTEKIRQAGIPAICLNYSVEGMDCILTDNESGMRELVEHMITVHGATKFLWLSGPSDHQDCQERLNVLQQVMGAYDILLPEENKLYGDWSFYSAARKVREWMENHDYLPDVIVCANDNMAIGACITLENMGISVPEQVKVTGFDFLECGQEFYPTLTTVERENEECCYKGILRLVERIDKDAEVTKIHFKTRLVPRESCGCVLDHASNRHRLLAFQKAYKKTSDNTMFNWHTASMDEGMVWVKSQGDMYRALQLVFEIGHMYEGDNFALCLDDFFVESIEGSAETRKEGYGDKIRVIYSMKDGVSQPAMYIARREMVPFYAADDAESHTYLFAPIHIRGISVGYIVLRDVVNLLEDFYLYILNKHLANGLERARQNVRMEILNQQLNVLSMTDKLTGLYNREGYEKYAIPRLEACRKDGLSAAIMVVDIDRMKKINDQYGHLQGDAAIITVAESVKAVLPESWYAIRYGGDEFVLVGECDSRQMAEELKQRILQQIAMKSEGKLPYRLTASIGYMMADPSMDLSIEEYFRGADQAMYMMKQMHEAGE